MNRRDLLKSVPVAAAVAAGVGSAAPVYGWSPLPRCYRVNLVGWNGLTASCRLWRPTVSVGDVVAFLDADGPHECYVESIEAVLPRAGMLIVERT